MKHKLISALKAGGIILLGVWITFSLFQFVDEAFHGFVGDFVKARYTAYSHYQADDGIYYSEVYMDWQQVKQDVLFLLTVNTVFWLAVVLAVRAWTKTRERRRMTDSLSQMIYQYLHQDVEASAVFPDGYAKISAEMAEVKSDISRKEQRLKEETARKNDLIAYLAHDLKTPLTSVIGYLSLLSEAPDMPPEQRAKYTGVALDKAYRLERMINEFFDITRYNLQQIVIQKEPIDLYYMLVQLTDELLPLLERNGNTAVLHASESLLLPGDPDQLARVFNNVLKNAAAYSYPNTQIDITAEERDGLVVISFANRGRTIPPEKLGAIFEKFYRLDEARASGTGGSGLGLAIAKEIVALHGGTITADSRDETVMFTVSLPAHEERFSRS